MVVRLVGSPPIQEPAPVETAPGTSTVTSEPPRGEGVHLIHQIPGGFACVRNQISRPLLPEETFTQLLTAYYKDADVVDALVEANDLGPDAQGAMTVYVPPGNRVVIPEMCYSKRGADAVSLQASGEPEPASAWGSVIALVVVALVVAFVVGLFRRLWRWGS